MAKPLDLDAIRKMDGPRPERWIPILCDEIERLQADHAVAIAARDEQIEELKKRGIEIIEGLVELLKKSGEVRR